MLGLRRWARRPPAGLLLGRVTPTAGPVLVVAEVEGVHVRQVELRLPRSGTAGLHTSPGASTRSNARTGACRLLLRLHRAGQ